MAIISSGTYVVQGGLPLVRINRLGQAIMEIFYCTNHEMTIEKDSLLGVEEKISEEDKVGKLNFNEMTANIQKMQFMPSKFFTTEKWHYVVDNVAVNVNAFKQKYMDMLLKHYEVISDNKYDLGKHDIELKIETPIYVKQFKIHDNQQEAVKQHVEVASGLVVKTIFQAPFIWIKAWNNNCGKL